MSDAESRREDAKREDWEDKHPTPPVDCGECGERTWRLRERYVYGDDADGNRGMLMEVWECACGNEMEVPA
ncbi:hypothetical protein LCGC14_2697560 [marine sediment metagenome]|uniref:Uncharacterized protein n=1 Tax=marine sediment metagenome TaxID=412755 RepID=A0A0F9C8K2_9ZZZZ